MAKKRQNRTTQKVVKFIETSNITPVYKTVSKKSNTKYSIRNKKNINDLKICGCENKMNSYIPKTWQSIMNMYGDAETTEAWNRQGKNPERILKPKKSNKDKRKAKQIAEPNNDFINDKSNVKSKYPKTLVKKSRISLYRKRNKRKRVLNRQNLKTNKQQEFDSNIKDKKNKVESPIGFDFFKRKPIIKSELFRNHINHKGTGDAFFGGLYSNYHKQRKENPAAEDKNILDKELVISNEKENLSNGKRKTRHKNTFLKDSSEKIMGIWSKCNLVKMFVNPHTSKSQNIVHDLKGEPLFEMKVDSVNMRVVNSSEINSKLKTLGKIKRRPSCICDSREKSLKTGGHNVCKKGICEHALFKGQPGFDCKCKRKKNLIVCNDTNCDSKKISKYYKNKKIKNKEKQRKPVVEVVLNRNSMTILNSKEIGKMFKKAPQYEICPTGICKEASKDPDIELICKCIGKKNSPMIKECTDETCVRTVKKCKLSKIWSRVFSKCENFEITPGFEISKVRGHKQRYHVANQQYYEKPQKKSGELKNTRRVSVPIALQLKRNIGSYANVCECNLKEAEVIKNKVKSVKRKKRKRLKVFKSLKTQTSFTHQTKLQNLSRHIIKCLQRKRVRCENKLKQKEKEFKESEKMADKENLKVEKIIKKNKNDEELAWNCMTNFVIGIINIGVNLIIKIFSMTFSMLLNPIGSFVYVRERAKDPPGTIKRIKGWLTRTWSNKNSRMSETIKQSNTMNVIADQIEDTAIYDALFANKGKTGAQKSLYERKRKLRKRRIQKRHDQALYGCRHMLLTTLRKTPCLWLYYICPDLYPQYLNLVTFMTNFCHLIIYLLALICWTPCIICFEGCRACLCCLFCTN
ncbi:uncharacterized protein LOC126768626 [Nymphalis io]|uniref:uncharacterized protein LOC126768626 n=1 Tax=Inachis io TaxID=171585 RepID=UPI002168BF1E|nr:uncharacterized protein LOC126768626 [Nymphalis io]